MRITDVVERPTDLTVEWLTAALGVPVGGFAFERIGTGQMSECYRISLTYADGAAGWCTRAGSWTPDRGGTGRRALTERRWSSLLSRDSLCGCKRVSAIFVAVV